MTTEEALIELYEVLGEPSELSPYIPSTTTFDITTEGAARMLKWLNRAYKRVLNWKFPNGSQVRFACQDGELFFKSIVKSGSVGAASVTSVTLDAGVDAEADRYNGSLIEITGGVGEGQKRVIVDFATTREATVDSAWETQPDATSTYSIYKRKYFFRGPLATDLAEQIPINPISQIAAISLLEDVARHTRLELGGRVESFTDSLHTKGIPCSYIEFADGLLFDVAAESEIWYRLEYRRVPPALVLATDEAELPDSFNEPLLLYAQWIGLRRNQEWGGAYATKKDIEDLMLSLKQSLEQAFEREDIGAVPS